MSVRKSINRYKTDPFGESFDDVVKRAKAFYCDGAFIVFKYGKTWNASRPAAGFNNPQGSVAFTKINGKWKEEGASIYGKY